MNHIAVRRLALTVASLSFGLLTALVLLVSAAYGEDLTEARLAAVQNQVTDREAVVFPFSISCTSLVVESVAVYDGPFHEDGTGREVFNTAAVLLRNTGNEMIPYAHVILRTDSASYIFDGFLIPAGAAVLIPEKYALSFVPQDNFTSCFGWSTVLQQQNMYEISIENVDMGSIAVTNLSDSEIRNLTLYHKTYLLENDLYIGGTAFSSRIDCIEAGGSVTLSPQYYASGYSKIVYYE